jgi:predicted Zn-ribbon and HTH transcriptional regulator
MTRFEEGAAELVRRRRLRLDPGPITIGLHPGLKAEPALMRHTLAHELLHAIGLLEHNEEHEHWVEKIAPLPKINDSPLLQEIQQRYLGRSSQKEWVCGHCTFTWPRKTLRKPTRCPKCAKVL